MIPTYQASFSQYRDKRLAPPKQNKIQCSGGRLAQYESSNVAADVSPRRKFQCSGGGLAQYESSKGVGGRLAEYESSNVATGVSPRAKFPHNGGGLSPYEVC